MGNPSVSWIVERAEEAIREEPQKWQTSSAVIAKRPQPAAEAAAIIKASFDNPDRLRRVRDGPALDRLKAFADRRPDWIASQRSGDYGEGATLKTIAEQAAAEIDGRLFWDWGLIYSPRQEAFFGWAKFDGGYDCCDDDSRANRRLDEPPSWECRTCGSTRRNDFEFKISEEEIALCHDPRIVIFAAPSPDVLCGKFWEHHQQVLEAEKAAREEAVEKCRKGLKRLTDPGLWLKARREAQREAERRGGVFLDVEYQLMDAANRLARESGFDDYYQYDWDRPEHAVVFIPDTRAPAVWFGVKLTAFMEEDAWVGDDVRFDSSGPNRAHIRKVLQTLAAKQAQDSTA